METNYDIDATLCLPKLKLPSLWLVVWTFSALKDKCEIDQLTETRSIEKITSWASQNGKYSKYLFEMDIIVL